MLLSYLLGVAAIQSGDEVRRFGAWSGACYRDGNLRGMADEGCRYDFHASPAIVIERDATRLTLTVYRDDCRGRYVDRSRSVPGTLLSRHDRVARLLRVVRSLTAQLNAICGEREAAISPSSAQLDRILRESDGLRTLSR